MNTLTRPGSPSLLRLIIELKGAGMGTNIVFLEVIGERDAAELEAELCDLEDAGLIAFAEKNAQWTPTFAGMLLGLQLAPYDPAEVLLDGECLIAS